jgi:hypothetical protein
MKNSMTTTADKKVGGFYAGASLPQGAKIIGTVTRNGGDTGALLMLQNGRQVQYNGGVIRSLPGLGRKAVV